MNITLWFWQRILSLNAHIYLTRTRPIIIGIGGSVGKTTTKDTIYAALAKALPTKRVRRAYGNLNTSVGLPLAILGFDIFISESKIIEVLPQLIWRALTYPKADILILEYAIDKPGDMEYLVKRFPPTVAVMTPISEEHTENLIDLDGVYGEELKLINKLPPNGTAIIPAEDSYIKQVFIARKISYGNTRDADVCLTNWETKLTGTKLDVVVERKKIIINSPLLGMDQNYAVLAALAVGVVLNAPLNSCADGIASYTPIPGRLRPIKGKKSVTIIDDSYNASPASMEAALKVLGEVAEKSRRVAILGEMKELGNLSLAAHQNLAKIVPKYADAAIFVGLYSDEMKRWSIKAGLKEADIYTFKSTSDAIKPILKIVQKGDVVLIKASQNEMRFERITYALMAHPENARELLVRSSRLQIQKL